MSMTGPGGDPASGKVEQDSEPEVCAALLKRASRDGMPADPARSAAHPRERSWTPWLGAVTDPRLIGPFGRRRGQEVPHAMKSASLFAALLASLFGLAAQGAPLATATRRPALWAFYYAWYETATGPHVRWSQWSEDKTTNPAPKPKSKAQPLIGYYDSDNPEAVRWHIRSAKAAGIEAFLVSWWGAGSMSGRSFEKTILPLAARENFKVALCSELAQFHEDIKALARETADVLRRTKDSPGYLHVDGKPLIYLYQVPFAPKLTPEAFTELRRDVEAEVGAVYWIMDKVTNVNDRGLDFPEEWLGIAEIPMMGFYGTFCIKRIWTYDKLFPHYQRLVNQAHAAGKKAFLPAHPGHDNSGFRPDDFFIIPRDDGATLRGYLRAATDAGADAIVVTSFNEWPETTAVEPSSTWSDPYFYLKILAEWKGLIFHQPALPEKQAGVKNISPEAGKP